MTTTRSARSAQRRAERTKKNRKLAIGVTCGVLAFAVGGGGFFLYNNVNDKTTAIEKHVPNDVDSLFVSYKNATSWEYFSVLSGYTNAIDPLNAERVGVAFKDDKSYLYVEGGKALEREISERDIKVEASGDGVFLLAGDKSGFVDDGLGKSDDYAGKNNIHDESFAYATNKYSDDDKFFAGESGIPTNDWVWTGTFTKQGWLGKIDSVTADQFDLKRFDAWVGFEKKPNWVKDGISKDADGNVNISYSPNEVSDITGNKVEMTDIDDIKVKIDKSNIMTLNFER